MNDLALTSEMSAQTSEVELKTQHECIRAWRKKRIKALNMITHPNPIVDGAEIAHCHNYKRDQITFSAWNKHNDPVNRMTLIMPVEHVLSCKTQANFIRRFREDLKALANPKMARL